MESMGAKIVNSLRDWQGFHGGVKLFGSGFQDCGRL